MQLLRAQRKAAAEQLESTGEGAPGSAFADALRIPPEMRAKTLPAPGNA